MQIGKSWPEYISQDLADSRAFGNILEKIERRGEREKHAATQRAEVVCGAPREWIRPSPDSAGFLLDAHGDKRE